MEKIAFIINPVSGKGAGSRFYHEIKSNKLLLDKNVDFFITEKPLDALEITKKISKTYNRILVGGGDGTLHEVINGLDVNSNVLIGLLPIGSGNDFALSLYGKNSDTYELLRYFLSDAPKYRLTNFGIIEIEDKDGNSYKRMMINSFGVGFDAKVAFYNQRNKTFSGTMSYIYAILKALFEFSRIDVKISVNNDTISQNALFCAVGNGKTIGGGLYLMPSAVIDDNFLNLSVVEIKSRLKLLLLFPKALSNKLSNRKELKEYLFRNISLELKKPFFAHIDGEIITDCAKNITIAISDNKFKFMEKN